MSAAVLAVLSFLGCQPGPETQADTGDGPAPVADVHLRWNRAGQCWEEAEYPLETRWHYAPEGAAADEYLRLVDPEGTCWLFFPTVPADPGTPPPVTEWTCPIRNPDWANGFWYRTWPLCGGAGA